MDIIFSLQVCFVGLRSFFFFNFWLINVKIWFLVFFKKILEDLSYVCYMVKIRACVFQFVVVFVFLGVIAVLFFLFIYFVWLDGYLNL